MLRINKYIFFDVCDKNIDEYNELIETIKKEYFKTIEELNNETECSVIRKIIHKLAGIVSILEGSNREVTYIIKTILSIDKASNDLDAYKFYIDMLMNLNTDNLF
jgi:two-component SAPR family response regulator